ncbi:MAG TPA: response regulator transcription factor [Ktedonobacteraceae bacterium]|nr:response regulator transcription factor [Ktedonobacteraceae bacterium]
MDQNSQIQAKQSNQTTALVLVIDDEESIIDLIKLGLKYEGFEVVAASDGEEGIASAQRSNPIFIILDWMLPDMDGLEVCRRLRSNPTTHDIPILLLTAKGEVGSRVEGLNTGADDYLTKPFSFEELVARIRAILRRLDHSAMAENSQVLTVGDIELNMATHEVTRNGQQIDLTKTEYDLLHLFMSHVGQALDRQTILNQVWGYDFLGETNIIEVYVRYLREKIENSPSSPRFIQTIRGVGYIMKS